MGFPKRTFDGSASYGFDGNAIQLFSTAYICPRCYTRTSEIPTCCCVCKVQLNSSSHIARSHHHLFPVMNFEELSLAVSDSNEDCTGYDRGNNGFNSNNSRTSNGGSNGGNSNDSRNSGKSTTLLAYKINDIPPEKELISKNGSSSSAPMLINPSITEDDRVLVGKVSNCKGCLETFTSASLVMQCPSCEEMFCIECDLFIHNSLHNCPGCA
jgi:transcription initiation factor TFIIH subunit 2